VPAQGNPLPGGALVEICTVVKTPITGHTFVLAGRHQNGSLANSASRGVDAVIIDPRYTLQAGCPHGPVWSRDHVAGKGLDG